MPKRDYNPVSRVKYNDIYGSSTRLPVKRGRAKFLGPESNLGGPGEPPAAFLDQWNSRSEWYVYWGLWQILHEVGDVRAGPFDGGVRFQYQTPILGGRNLIGGQVVDFVVEIAQGAELVGMFLQSDLYHITGGPDQIALDLDRMIAASRYMRIVPIEEYDIIRDPTGQQACETLVKLLGGRQAIGPTNAGDYIQARLNVL